MNNSLDNIMSNTNGESVIQERNERIFLADNKSDTKTDINEINIYKDKLRETDNSNNTLSSKRDIVINITAATEASVLRNNIVQQKQTTWVYSQYFTKHLWQQRRQPHPQQQQQQYYNDAWTQHGTGGQGFSGNDYDGTPLIYDPETRNSFVRLVMIITLVMLLLTAGFLGFVLSSTETKDFFRKNTMVFLIIGLVILMIPNYGMMCFPMLRRAPCSFFMLFLALCSMSLMAASITCHYKTEIVLQAVVATSAIVLVCLALACTSFDFTKLILFVIVIIMGISVVAMIVFATSLITNQRMTTVYIVILAVSVIAQAVMLVIELQMILGGKSLEIDEEDYALAAFMLYTSIIDIFMKMVQILGFASN